MPQAKQKLAVDPTICSESSLPQVLQKVHECLQDAVPQEWVSLSADVSDMMAVRLGFVEGSEKIFMERKDLLERFITIRSLYALTLLRDLCKLKKTSFKPPVNLLISALQVDIDNSLKLAAARANVSDDGRNNGSEPSELPKPHKVAALVPGFDVLQSSLASNNDP